MFNSMGVDSAERPWTLACRPINEPFKVAASTTTPVSRMLSSTRLLVILQSAPMEAFGPIVELLIVALSMDEHGRYDACVFPVDAPRIITPVFQQVTIGLEDGLDRAHVEPDLDGLGAHFQPALDHDVDRICEEVLASQ